MGSLCRCLCKRPDHLDLDEDVVVRQTHRAQSADEQSEIQTFASRELRTSYRMAERRKKMREIVASRKAENAAMRERKDKEQKVRSHYIFP